MRTLPIWALCASLLAACGAHPSGKPIHRFPTRAELQQTALTAPSGLPEKLGVVTVEAFRIESPANDLLGDLTHHASTVGAKLSAAAATQTGNIATDAMDCVASEVARVYATLGNGPDQGLLRFITARCGAVASRVHTMVWRPNLQANLPLEDALRSVERDLSAQITRAISGQKRTHVGVGAARGETGVAIVLAQATPTITLVPRTRVADENRQVIIEGRIESPVTALAAHINDGAYGVRPCEVDPSLTLPDFRVRCELAESDPAAWVEFSTLPPGRVLWDLSLSVLAIRASDEGRTYERMALPARPVSDRAAFEAAVFELVNVVRHDAKLAPLALADKQSQAVQSFVKPFIASMFTEGQKASDVINTISLGLMAGWDVQGGVIRNAKLVCGLEVTDPDAARWLADMLESPTGRLVMLAPDAKSLALGAHLDPESKIVGALALSYAFFEPEKAPGERAEAIAERLAKVRKARGLGATKFVTDLPGIKDALKDIEKGESVPTDAMSEAMTTIVYSTGRSVRGIVWETHDLDAIEFPPELLRRGDLVLGAGVTFYKPEGGAWGQYAVIFVLVDVPDGGEA